eukprot:gene34595-57399_t
MAFDTQRISFGAGQIFVPFSACRCGLFRGLWLMSAYHFYRTFNNIFTPQTNNCCAAFVRLLNHQCFLAAQWDAGGDKIKTSPRKAGKPADKFNRREIMKLGNRLIKATMLSTISIASLGLGTVAHAQDAAPQAEEEASEDNVIIVTATKREQTLQDVPISVSVTSAETIERSQVRDLIDLQTLVPSLK